ncbi:MAG: hypothetical protein EZS28_051916, partial [Streblomastix strix]
FDVFPELNPKPNPKDEEQEESGQLNDEMKDEEYDGESYELQELDPQELELQLSVPYELVPKVPVPYELVPKDDPNVLPVKYELSELQNDESGRIVDDEDDDYSDEGKEEKIQLKSLPSFVIIGIGGFEVD